MSRTAWADKITALAARIEAFPTKNHPAIKGLIQRYETLLDYGLTHEFISPREAARA